ncbi:MAG: hypothetical protein JWQ90_3647 [Hydrocarboniphaga sp.]|uniref:hypothetical protein n=1 Tax=Hydrocarboniphaga sp. TaxID=2033016 RepID=UPI00261066B3|nr:hypothetical protein [Hydrocarboniphaga sp.]MDB5971197.1 hypothetical protein [Hydrocarboniphaga sp.]
MRKLLLATLALFPMSAAQANPDVTSREYKLMLLTSAFSYNTEAANVDSFLDTAESTIEAAISRTVTGSDYLATSRDLKFYDTAGSCVLDHSGYAFRERIENGSSEVTLKFRSPDRYISDFEDLSSTSSQAETKLEEDIGASASSFFKSVYSHSTTAPNTRTINKMDDINIPFPGFGDDYGFSDSLDLVAVGGLTLRERVYKGRTIDLGDFDGAISVTLWYNGAPSGAVHPLAAEVSFKYEDSSADYTKSVVNRAKTAFAALQTLTAWVDPDSDTKTRFVYNYNPSFCY